MGGRKNYYFFTEWVDSEYSYNLIHLGWVVSCPKIFLFTKMSASD